MKYVEFKEFINVLKRSVHVLSNVISGHCHSNIFLLFVLGIIHIVYSTGL